LLTIYIDRLEELRINAYLSEVARDTITPKIHPTQKSIYTLKTLIELYTDINDVVIDPCAGSGSTLLAAKELNRRCYGFEIKKEFVKGFYEKLNRQSQRNLFAHS